MKIHQNDENILNAFLEFYKVNLNLPEIKRKETIGLGKTRWVAWYKAYKANHLLYKAIVFTFKSVKNRNLYDDFYNHLGEKYNENWTWDAETKIKARRLFSATKSFEHISVFSLVFNELESLKPLVTKLQKRNQDICKAYQMIDNAISEVKCFIDNVDIDNVKTGSTSM